MASFEDKKETLTEQPTEEAVYRASGATLVWDENEGLAAEESNDEVSTPSAENNGAEQSNLDDIDLSMLDLPEEKTAEGSEDAQNISSLPGYEEFASDFQKFTGLELKQAVNLVNELQQFKAQQVVQTQQQQLQQAWGVEGSEFNSRLEMVRERFTKYPPELQARLDNPDGAQLIWAKIQQEQAAKQKQVPKLDKSNAKVTANQQQKYMFTRSQIAKMSNEEYSQQANKIAYAYQNGLVK